MKKSHQQPDPPKTHCTVPLPLSSPAEIRSLCLADLLSRDTVQHYGEGDTNQPSDSWRNFHLLLIQGTQGKNAALELLRSKHPGARIYGAVLLRQCETAEGTKWLTELLKDKSKVVYMRGSVKQESSVSALAARLLKGDELILLTDPRTKKSDADESLKSKHEVEVIGVLGFEPGRGNFITTNTGDRVWLRLSEQKILVRQLDSMMAKRVSAKGELKKMPTNVTAAIPKGADYLNDGFTISLYALPGGSSSPSTEKLSHDKN